MSRVFKIDEGYKYYCKIDLVYRILMIVYFKMLEYTYLWQGV